MKLEDVFYIDETSPSGLRWKIKREMFHPYYKLLCSVGDIAGKQDRKGYWVIGTRSLKTEGEKLVFLAHRVVWELTNGAIEDGYIIDHIDGNPSNNTLANLRLVTYSLNSRNRASYDGRNGVSLCRKFWPNSSNFTDYWLARITGEGGKRIQKNFSTKRYGYEEAHNMAVNWYIDQKQIQTGYTDRHMT